MENCTKVFALGGLGEIGKNMYCVMKEDELIIIDAGVIFPQDLMGVDYVIPDFTYLKRNETKIKALFITHGHEDHIGGIPFLLQHLNIPKIYAPNQAIGLIKKKLDERNIKYPNLFSYTEENNIKFKKMNVEFFMTTHSIPDSHGMLITTKDGKIVTTGDFKFDLTPIGPIANIHKMANIGQNDVTLLLSDSTNALNEGFSNSESIVDDTLSEIFKKHNGRIIIATFASNIYRLKHIVDTCKRNDRKIAIFGRSMTNNIEISIEGGYIDNKELFISPEEANKLPDNKVCLLCTGSQGEPLAALSRIAQGSHRSIKLQKNDTVVFSSSPIPGNAISISRTINRLYLKGVKVYTNTTQEGIHTSGHASSEELKLMLRLIKPKYFMPVHGEYRMLRKHANIANLCQIPEENCFILENGNVLNIKDGVITQGENVHSGQVYVDGNRIGDINNVVMKERKMMSQDGIVIINLILNNNKLISRPMITARGFVTVNDNFELLKQLEKLCETTIINKLKTSNNKNDLKISVINSLSGYINEKTGRNPTILPILTEPKKMVSKQKNPS